MQNYVTIKEFAPLDHRLSNGEYNFAHFRTKHLVNDARRTMEKAGIQAGEAAPGFELPRVGGGSLRLSALRGQPVLLHFGSFS